MAEDSVAKGMASVHCTVDERGEANRQESLKKRQKRGRKQKKESTWRGVAFYERPSPASGKNERRPGPSGPTVRSAICRSAPEEDVDSSAIGRGRWK